MRKIILFLLILFIGIAFSGEPEYPKILDVNYDIHYRHGKTEYADLSYAIEIQGTNTVYTMLLEVILYNSANIEIKTFKQMVMIKDIKYQVFKETKMIPVTLASDIVNIGVRLKSLSKKY